MDANLHQILYKVIGACVAVLLAMIIDLVCGLHKAKQRGEYRTSKGLRMTINKFLHYEGAMLIAAIFDYLIYLSNFYTLFHLNVLMNVPVVTCLIGMFLLVIEFHSVREKADQKSKSDAKEVARMVAKVLDNDSLKEALVTALEESSKEKRKTKK